MAGNGRPTRGRPWLWAGVAVAACGAVGAVTAVWWVPPKLYPADAPDARAALQSGLLTATAALIAVVGGLIALAETQKANAEVRRANENTHVRELYVEAVKLLNDTDRGIRLAGIYALERVAVDSPDDQYTVVEVLSAFVRDHATPGRHTASLPTPADRAAGTVARVPAGPDTDVQAALTVLGRLPPTPPRVPRADLVGAHLAGVRLSGRDMSHAQLDGANLTDARLVVANLTGIWLEGADLTGARLSGADLTGAKLYGADLTGAQLGGADLTGAELYGADLTRAGLTQEQVDAAHGDGVTKLPAGLARPASWPEEAVPLRLF